MSFAGPRSSSGIIVEIQDLTGSRLVDRRQLRQIAIVLLRDLFAVTEANLSVVLMTPAEITRLNENFVGHAGPTDVITFDYRAAILHERVAAADDRLDGEICICIEEAKAQAERFHVRWQRELIRYLVHGILHLRGYDDLNPVDRRRMKREENRLLNELAGRCRFESIRSRNAPQSKRRHVVSTE